MSNQIQVVQGRTVRKYNMVTKKTHRDSIFLYLASCRIMSDNIPPTKQRVCAELYREDEKYILDIYSCLQQEQHRLVDGLRKQIILFITRAKQNNRSTFLQVCMINLKRCDKVNLLSLPANLSFCKSIIKFICLSKRFL